MTNSWKHAGRILQTLEQNGYEGYFVGGCVRDTLLQRPVKDIDITTSAMPEQVIELFEQVIPIGMEHGTVLLRYEGQSFEVTTFRRESIDVAQKCSNNFSHLKEDLGKRDFTMNAIAMDRQYTIIDPFDGRKDINAKSITAVGEARARFEEDPLRMLRALRFVSQLGFQIAFPTLKQMNDLKDMMEKVAVERIKQECEKIFQGDNVLEAISLMRSTRMELALPIFRTYPELLTKMQELKPTPFVSFADVIALFHYVHSDVSIATWVKEWKCSNKEKKRAAALHTYMVYYHENGLDNWLTYQMHSLHIAGFCHLTRLLFPHQPIQQQWIHQKKATLPICSKEDIQINGKMVAALFPDLHRGRWIKEIIEKIEYLIVTNQMKNKYSIIKEWVLCHPPEKN